MVSGIYFALAHLSISSQDSSKFCHLLITFANSLDQDRAQPNVGPDLDSSCLTLMMVMKEYYEKSDVNIYIVILKYVSSW